MQQNINIALIGYGKMGREIETQANKRGIPISQKIGGYDDLCSASFAPNEIAIEFSTPEACMRNIDLLLSKHVSVICGTTGWYERETEVREMVARNKGCFLYASNFSIGVHLFWQALQSLAATINQHPDYDVSLEETHHLHKKDKPSGTARTCQQIITNSIARVEDVATESLREGEVFGDHRVFFDSPVDRIELSHHAKSRAGFAIGAIKCAQWIAGKQGFFTIEDYLSSGDN